MRKHHVAARVARPVIKHDPCLAVGHSVPRPAAAETRSRVLGLRLEMRRNNLATDLAAAELDRLHKVRQLLSVVQAVEPHRFVLCPHKIHQLWRRVVHDVVEHKRVGATVRVADGHHVKKVLGSGASRFFLCHEQLHGLARRYRRFERHVQLLHYMLKSRLLNPPSVDLFVIAAKKWPRRSTFASSVHVKPHDASARLTERMKVRPQSKNPLSSPL